MGLRFRQSFKLFPGVRLNLSKTGLSASFGGPGATLNMGSRGLRSTVGIPGTGLSYQTQHSFSTRGKPQLNDPQSGGAHIFDPSAPNVSPQLSPAYWQAANMREIGSASVEQLTSASLRELRDIIAEARSQRNDIQDDLRQARALLESQTSGLERRQRSLFRYFYKRRIGELEVVIPKTSAEVQRLEAWLEATHVEMKFETGDAAKKAYASLVRAFEAVRHSARIWDITSDRNTHRVLERTTASRMIGRNPAVVEFSTSDLVRFEGRPMRFQNVNGEDILIYPGMAVMPRADGAFALIDLREMRLESNAVQFIEEESVPPDSQVVGQTWAKANKDGSPDLRFKGNYSIPICLYGRLLFTSPAGIEEEYQLSNAEAAANFARAFSAYQAALSAE